MAVLVNVALHLVEDRAKCRETVEGVLARGHDLEQWGTDE